MTLRSTRRLINRKIIHITGFAAVVLSFCFTWGCVLWTAEKDLAPLAHVSTLAGANGEFGEPFGVAVSGGAIYVSDGEKDSIWRMDPEAAAEVFVEKLDTPSGIAFGPNGDLIIADTGSHTIRSADRSGRVSIIAGTEGTRGVDDGEALDSRFNGPIGVAASPDGRIYIADTYNDRIRLIADGKVSTLAGSSRGFRDGIGNDAMFDTPTGLAIWGEKLLVADTGNGRIRVVEKNGHVWTLAGNGPGELEDGLLSAARLFRPTSINVAAAASAIYFTDGNSLRRINFQPFASVNTLTNDRRGFEDGPASQSRFNRPSGVAMTSTGSLVVTDSANGLVRKITAEPTDRNISPEQLAGLLGDPGRFRQAAPPRWPYDPPYAPRDIAGTLGEIRGEIGESRQAWFHNGLDIAGAYGETARFIRDEKVLDPQASDNFGTLRELIRMPTLGYIHIRLGRDQNSAPFGDPRFLFDRDPTGKLVDVRVPRGSRFAAGEPIGTLNAMNHVHLIAGRPGYEMNALDALVFPGISDERSPTIEKVTLLDENWGEFETRGENSRIQLTRKARVVVRAFDQMDGNPERRRLGVYLVRWGLRSESPVMQAIMGEWKFERLPTPEMVSMIYAPGSRSGADGGTAFNYIASNSVKYETISEEFLDPEKLENGVYALSVQVADYFGNTTSEDITFEVNK